MEENEIKEIMDIVSFCLSEINSFPLSVQFQILQEVVKLGENLKPIYELYKNKRESKVLDILKELLSEEDT